MAVEKKTDNSAAELLKAAALQLKSHGIEEAEHDAFLLLEHVAGITKKEYLLKPFEPIGERQANCYRKLVNRRAEREPLQYITGTVWFYGFPFSVTPDVLIPRQDTEVLVEEALRDLQQGAEVLDLCTGSGCIAVAMKKSRPDLSVTASDISEKALDTAIHNAGLNECRISFCKGNLFEAVSGKTFDLIVSNPPYVAESEYEELMDEVRLFEPKLALTAGTDGLDIYRKLIGDSKGYLKKGGRLALEIGCSQAEAVTELLKKNRFINIRVLKDLAGLDRVVSANL